MGDDPKVRSLLEEVLNSGRTPEEVCTREPERLNEVRVRWRRIRELAGDLQRAFPTQGRSGRMPTIGDISTPHPLPQIPGYDVKAVIGHGGMGKVYKARHVGLDRDVAIKMLRTDHASPRELAALVREAQALAGLKHPHIVQVHDVGEFNGLPYFTMEYVEGGSLAQRLAGEPQPTKKAAEWLSVLAHATHAAHERGIVHRDLKPGNVLAAADGTLKITDFGLARRLAGSSEPTQTIGLARVGTPSYMPPEQALGTRDAFKPTADIYSLGAILYEVLTGRPPFRGESPAETERQLLYDEPVPPRRLNPRTAPDLQTICLKCLQKAPDRRYATAHDLADDLDRFRRGESIRARPVGFPERALKWSKRRPAQAGLLALGLFVLATGLAAGLWYQSVIAQRRAETASRERESYRSATAAMEEASLAIVSEAWDEADRVLAHAKTRGLEANSPELESKIESLVGAVRLARMLDETRQSRVMPLGTNVDLFWVVERFAAHFRDEGFPIDTDPHACAEMVRASPIRAQLIAALDSWASLAYDLGEREQCERLLAIARDVDPHSAWRNRFRTPLDWGNRDAVVQLATDAKAAMGAPGGPAPHQVGLLGLRLGQVRAKDEGIELLRSALLHSPGDFWMNWELGWACRSAHGHKEAIAPLRVAAAIRPRNAFACDQLARSLLASGDADEGFPMAYRATELAPDSTKIRYNLLFALAKYGRWPEAEAVMTRWTSLDESGCHALMVLTVHYLDTRRYDKAVAALRRIWEVRQVDVSVIGNLGIYLYALNRYAEAEAAIRDCIRFAETDPKLRGTSVLGQARAFLSLVLFATGRVEESITEAQAALANSLDVQHVLPPLGEALISRGRVAEAIVAFEQLSRLAPADLDPWLGLARAQLGLRQFTESRTTLDHAATLAASDSQKHQLARLRELHARISALHQKSPELLFASAPALEPAELRDLAEWHWRCAGNSHLAYTHYSAALAADPSLSVAPDSRDRFNAGCAALAASIISDSVPGSGSPEEGQGLRNAAYTWLSEQHDTLDSRRRAGMAADRIAVGAEFRSWLRDPTLAAICGLASSQPTWNEDADRWRELWSIVSAAAALDDPAELLMGARRAAAASNWKQARDCYANLLEIEPDQDGDVWFEYAAVQLLVDDPEGYRQACERMIAAKPTSSKIAARDVVRVRTLAPPPDVGASAPHEIVLPDDPGLDLPPALTTKAAVKYRNGQSTDDTISLLEQSMGKDSAPGTAIPNWLWLSLANHRAGNLGDARRWFTKADAWLRSLGGDQPPADGLAPMHLHTWLEAQILHREVAGVLAAPPPQSASPVVPARLSPPNSVSTQSQSTFGSR